MKQVKITLKRLASVSNTPPVYRLTRLNGAVSVQIPIDSVKSGRKDFYVGSEVSHEEAKLLSDVRNYDVTLNAEND